MKTIYLDHSATTPVDKDVLKAMLPYFSQRFGNPSSIHSHGQIAAAAVDKSREQVSSFLNCQPNEVIFTAGATESNNIVIKGLIKALGKTIDFKPHIVTSLIEHSAILEPCAELQKDGIEVTYLKPGKNGVISAESVRKAIKPNTALVSIMYVNNEVGSIQPIKEIGKMIFKHNENNLKIWNNTDIKSRGEKPRRIYFHTDATQAVSFCDCDVDKNYLDFLSMSGHKIYGPKGVGALYIRNGVNIKAIMLGGHQERNIRNGTLNAPAIVGLGTAISQLSKKSVEKNNLNISALRNMLIKGVMKKIPDTVLNTDIDNATPAHAHFSFIGVEGESILIAMDIAGISVSTGSACASGSLKPSHVLLAMGIKQEVAHNSIRFTLGKYTTKKDIDRVIRTLPLIIKKLRKIRENIVI